MLEKLFSPVFVKRVRKFRTLKRGYYSFLLLLLLFGLSLFNEFLISNKAVFVRHKGVSFWPVLSNTEYKLKDFGIQGYKGFRPVQYRQLKKEFELAAQDILQKKGPAEYERFKAENYVIMPPYPYGPVENLLQELEGRPPHPPSREHWLGTDDRGRDVLARLVYGFRISVTFGIVVTFLSYLLGVAIGALLGYYGGKIDMVGLRLVEIWSAVPFLYAAMIISSVARDKFPAGILLVTVFTVFGWMGITYYVRGEFYRERTRDYVSAAISIGLSDMTIIFKHILPNALTSVISYIPFSILSEIVFLVSLDFLGFGFPPPTPSWGELLGQGLHSLRAPWLAFAPMTALFGTLLLVSFIGEAAREAFDPKEYSRLR